jgi:hypothetical protein
MYHCSNLDLDVLIPQVHYLINTPVVFASTHKEFALTFISKWTDDDFDLSRFNDEPFIFTEKHKDNLNKFFKDKTGWLYVLDPKTFIKFKDTEYISYEEPIILEKIKISDALIELEKSKIILLRM